MNATYVRPGGDDSAVRLHLNENTAGCSGRVVQALSGMTPQKIARYTDPDEAAARCAAHLQVPIDRLLLTNGMDEGILAAAVAWLQALPDGRRAEAIVPLPAFEQYAVSIGAVGASFVSVPPAPDLRVSLEAMLACVTPRTRAVFLTSPGNPTGVELPHDLVAGLADALPPGALVFLDEAYVDFGGHSFLPRLEGAPRVVVARTFSKAYGLAGLRIGALLGAPEVLEPLRRVVPPYTINVCALAALGPALDDVEHLSWYRDQVERSRRRIYAACARWQLDCWPSLANFVLVRVGARAAWLARALAARGILVRDRTTQPGCAGCIRITAGVESETDRCLAAMEELLCAGP